MALFRGIWLRSSVRTMSRCKERKPGSISSKWRLRENIVLPLMECLPPTYLIYAYMIYILYIFTLCLYIHIYIYIYNAHTLFKSKIWNQQPGTYLGSQTARICSKKCIVRTEILLAEALAFNKCFLSEIRYMYKTKNLKAHYGIT